MTARGTLQRAFITLLLASGVYVDAAKWMARKFKHLPDKKLLSELVFLEIPSNSLMGCAQLCSTDPGCLTLSWQQGDLTCVFSGSEIWGESDVSKILGDSFGWITLAAARFPVFNVWRGTHYNMTMAEAETECRKRGLRLAAPSDLLLARSLGLEYCVCAWLNDNTNGFVLQAANSACWGTYNDQIIRCGITRANAWCLQTYLYF